MKRLLIDVATIAVVTLALLVFMAMLALAVAWQNDVPLVGGE